MSSYTFNLKNPNGSIDTVVIEADSLTEALQICRRDYKDPYTTEKPQNSHFTEKL